MAANEQPFYIEAIVCAVGKLHPPAIVCARAGQPTVISDGFEELLLEGADGQPLFVLEGTEKRPLRNPAELMCILDEMAKAYALEPPSRRALAEQHVDALSIRWIVDANAASSPRLWGLCAPGRPRDAGMRSRVVFYDAPHPLTQERIATEALRLHPAAYVCLDERRLPFVYDGASWLMFIDFWDSWRWSLGGEYQGEVLDFLGLQLVLAKVAAAYAAMGKQQRRRAEEHVRELSQLPLAQRYEWVATRIRSWSGAGLVS